MLYSLYTSEGIVFAADSRITRSGSAAHERSRPKVLRVGRVGPSTGLIGYYGLAQVKGRPMADWLASLIASWPGSRNPEDFADLLVECLNRDALPSERKEISGSHFGAFRGSAGRVEPLFFHVVNTHGFDVTTGLHTDPGARCRDALLVPKRRHARLRPDYGVPRDCAGSCRSPKGLSSANHLGWMEPHRARARGHYISTCARVPLWKAPNDRG